MNRTLEDRLLEWEERRERGESVSAASLCGDAPELEPELARLIDILESAERILDVNATTPVAAVTVGGPRASRPPAGVPRDIGRYAVRTVLGRGGTCVVYHAWDPTLRLDVALKVLRDEMALDREQQEALAARLTREAQTLARLRHDHIVRFYEPGLADGRPYFVLEYVRGGSLRERLGDLSAAGPRAYVPLLEQVARAVQYAHENGVLHRDLKPANILLTDDGRALVSDFGLVKLLADGVDETADTVLYTGPEEDPDLSERLTRTGTQPGTPAYMAPEQYDRSFGEVGYATDVWALGVILYELLTGDKPFRGRTRAEVRAQVCGGQLERPRKRWPGADRRLEAIALRCLQPDPRRRYQSAGEVAGALAGWQRSRRRFHRLASVVMVGCLVVLAGIIAIRETSPERRYQRATAGLVDSLRRGKEANFLPAGAAQAPPHRVRVGEAGATVGHSPDGLVIECGLKCCLVELCPEVPLEHYRLRARLRISNKPPVAPRAAWGVYVNHTPVNTTPGPQHYFEAAYFVDDAQFLMRPGFPGPFVVQAALSPCWFSDQHATSFPGSAEAFPYRNARGDLDPARPVREGATALEPLAAWRALQIDVHGNEVSARAGGGGLARDLDLGTIRPPDRTKFLQGLATAWPDLQGTDSTAMTGKAAGIYLSAGVVAVGEFVIEPLPAP
jgi:serine/threonine-protein kinase